MYTKYIQSSIYKYKRGQNMVTNEQVDEMVGKEELTSEDVNKLVDWVVEKYEELEKSLN